MAGLATYQGQNPYLSVWDIISLGWLHFPILALIAVSFGLWIASQSAASGVADAKKALMEACGAAEKAATVAANIPRYIAQATTEELNSAIKESIAAAHAALDLILTVLEKLISYIVDVFKATELCFFQFIVKGSLAVVIEFTQLVQQFLSTILGGIASGFDSAFNFATSAVNSVIDGMNGAINGYNSALGWLTGDIGDISHVTIGFNTNEIRNFNIPNSFVDELNGVSNSLPSISTLDTELDSLVTTPFELIKSEMNTTFAGITTPTVDIPLPPVETVEFCSHLDTGFVDEVGADLVKIAHIGIAILLTIALIIFVVNGFFVWVRWKLMARHLDTIQNQWASGEVSAAKPPTVTTKSPTGGKNFFSSVKNVFHSKQATAIDEKDAPVADPPADTAVAPAVATTQLTPEALLTLDNQLTHPFAYKVLEFIERLPFVHLTPITRDRIIWFLSYIYSPYPLVFFLVGLFGIIAVCIQLIAVHFIQKKVDEEVANVVNLVLTTLRTDINDKLGSDSAEFASTINTGLAAIDEGVNGELFGWISHSTSSINNTIVAYYNDMQTGVTRTFGSSLLANPVHTFLQCLIGNKIAALEGAVAYLQAHLHIPIPRLPSDVLLLSNQTLEEITQPIADAAIGGGDGGIFGALVNLYTEALMGLLLVFGCLLGVWGVAVVMGLSILLWDVFRHRQTNPVQEPADEPVHEKGITEATVASSPAPVRPAWWQRFSTNRTLWHGSEAKDIEKGGDLKPEPTRTSEEATTARSISPTVDDNTTAAVHESQLHPPVLPPAID